MGLLTKAGTWLARGLGLADPRLYAYFGLGPTDAGETVTVDGALQIGAVLACVRRYSDTISTLPLHLYTAEDGNSKVIPEHPLYRVLHDRPNVEMTAAEFWGAMVASYLLWGNAYAAIRRGAGGRIVALDPMRPDFINLRREADGSLFYVYSWVGGTEYLPEDEVFHVKGFSVDGLTGLSPVSMARQTLGAARAAERASGSMFRNGMRPSGVFTTPDYLKPEQREIAKKLINDFSGAQNTGRIPLLEGGWDFKQLSIPPEDAQLLQTRAFHVEEICRWFDVPPILVGHSGQTTWGSGIEQIMLGWIMLGLRSHLKRIEQAIQRALLLPREQGKLFAEFNVDALMRADSTGRAHLYAAYVQNGLRTRNEVRALDNLPPIPGGDDLTVQSNLLPIDKLGEVAKLPRASEVKPGADIMHTSTTGANIPG